MSDIGQIKIKLGSLNDQRGQIKVKKVKSYIFLSLTRNKTGDMSLIILIGTHCKILAFINFLLKNGLFRTLAEFLGQSRADRPAAPTLNFSEHLPAKDIYQNARIQRLQILCYFQVVGAN